MAREKGHLVIANNPGDDVAIRVEHVSKSFRLPHNRQNSIKGSLVNLVSRGDRTFETQEVLKDISFEIKKGEFFGIVGRNGSGKSTLLKMLAGIYTPSRGKIIVNGSLTPFIELGVGFNPELTGRENVYLNGALLGFNGREVDAMYDDIVAFAELERFMDQKLKNYSSGMQVRLAFSIAIRARSQILVLDEVLAVGDEAFQQKCLQVFRDLKREKRTIILVTHDMSNVERFCDRALVVDYGVNKGVHIPTKASLLYSALNSAEDTGDGRGAQGEPDRHKPVRVEHVSLDHPEGLYKFGDALELSMRIGRDKAHVTEPVLTGLAIYNNDGVTVAGPNDSRHPALMTASELMYRLPRIPFQAGKYYVSIALYDADGIKRYDFRDKSIEFTVISDHAIHGVVELKEEWS